MGIALNMEVNNPRKLAGISLVCAARFPVCWIGCVVFT